MMHNLRAANCCQPLLTPTYGAKKSPMETCHACLTTGTCGCKPKHLDDGAEVVNVDSKTPTFLAVSAGNYHAADLALWRVKTDLGDGPLEPRQEAHLEQLRTRRKECYFDLISWAMIAEAERLEGTKK